METRIITSTIQKGRGAERLEMEMEIGDGECVVGEGVVVERFWMIEDGGESELADSKLTRHPPRAMP